MIGPEAKRKRGKEGSKKGKEAKGEQGGRFHFFVTVPDGLLRALDRGQRTGRLAGLPLQMLPSCL